MAPAPMSRAAPRARWTLASAAEVVPSRWRIHDPRKAAGTDPAAIQPTNPRLIVRFWKWTAAPTGRMTTAATRSEEMAVDGFTENSRISMGVISAPPPAPVMPTRRPTTALPNTM